MNDQSMTPAPQQNNAASLAEDFAGPNGSYYAQEFAKIGSSRSFRPSFNMARALLGPDWYAARHLWSSVLVFAALEILALVTLARGLFKDLGFEESMRGGRIAETLEKRAAQAEAAVAEGSANAANLQRAVDSLERAVADSIAAAEAAAATDPYLAAAGLISFLLLRGLQAAVANSLLEKRFTAWRSERAMAAGLSMGNAAIAAALVVVTYGL